MISSSISWANRRKDARASSTTIPHPRYRPLRVLERPTPRVPAHPRIVDRPGRVVHPPEVLWHLVILPHSTLRRDLLLEIRHARGRIEITLDRFMLDTTDAGPPFRARWPPYLAHSTSPPGDAGEGRARVSTGGPELGRQSYHRAILWEI